MEIVFKFIISVLSVIGALDLTGVQPDGVTLVGVIFGFFVAMAVNLMIDYIKSVG